MCNGWPITFANTPSTGSKKIFRNFGLNEVMPAFAVAAVGRSCIISRQKETEDIFGRIFSGQVPFVCSDPVT